MRPNPVATGVVEDADLPAMEMPVSVGMRVSVGIPVSVEILGEDAAAGMLRSPAVKDCNCRQPSEQAQAGRAQAGRHPAGRGLVGLIVA